MSTVAALCILLILSLSTAYVFRRRTEYTLALTAAFISLVLYASSFFNSRSIGYWLILIVTFVMAAISIYLYFTRRSSLRQILTYPGAIYVTIASLATLVITRGFVFNGWDEFSHWGLVVKNLFLSNDFGNLANSTTVFQSYPQSISLFESFFTFFGSQFREASVLVALLVLSYIQLSIVFVNMRSRPVWHFLAVAVCVVVLPTIVYPGFYSSIYVDAILGLLFANIIIFHLSYRKLDWFYALYLSLQSYMLINTKQIGLFLAGLAFICIIVDYIKRSRASKKQLLRRDLIYIIAPITTGALSFVAWRLYCSLHHVNEVFTYAKPHLNDILALFTSNIPGYRRETIMKFVDNIFGPHIFGGISLSYVMFGIVLVAATWYAIRLIATKKHSDDITTPIIVAIGYYVYMGLLLSMYLFTFWDIEAKVNASFERYIGSYVLPLLVISVYMVVSSLQGSSNRKRVSGALIVLLLLITANAPLSQFVNSTLLAPWHNADRRADRSKFADSDILGKKLDRHKDRVYIISQGDFGEHYWKLKYGLTPVPVSPSYSWSLGQPYSTADIYSKPKTPGDWGKELQGYTYVYLYHIDDQFRNTYGVLFNNPGDISDRSLYRVKTTAESVLLERASL